MNSSWKTPNLVIYGFKLIDNYEFNNDIWIFVQIQPSRSEKTAKLQIIIMAEDHFHNAKKLHEFNRLLLCRNLVTENILQSRVRTSWSDVRFTPVLLTWIQSSNATQLRNNTGNNRKRHQTGLECPAHVKITRWKFKIIRWSGAWPDHDGNVMIWNAVIPWSTMNRTDTCHVSLSDLFLKLSQHLPRSVMFSPYPARSENSTISPMSRCFLRQQCNSAISFEIKFEEHPMIDQHLIHLQNFARSH